MISAFLYLRNVMKRAIFIHLTQESILPSCSLVTMSPSSTALDRANFLRNVSSHSACFCGCAMGDVSSLAGSSDALGCHTGALDIEIRTSDRLALLWTTEFRPLDVYPLP